MKRSIGLLLAVLGAASVSCGSSPSGGASARAHVDQSTTTPDALTSAVPSSGTTAIPSASGAASADPAAQASTAPQPGGPGRPAATAPATGPTTAASTPAPTGPGMQPPAGWKLTVYYTAVESFHQGAPQAVTGCDLNASECSNGTTPLGSYPSDFVAKVRDQGTGRITSGRYAGKYLAWDAQGGFSLDTAATDVNGNPMHAFISAASDEGIPLGTHFTVQDCGIDSTTRQPPDAASCSRLTAPEWVVVDRSDQPPGSRELDLYVGEENQPDFEHTVPYVVSTVNARTTLR